MKNLLLLLVGLVLGFALATISQPMLFAESGVAIERVPGVIQFGGGGVTGSIIGNGPVRQYHDSTGRHGTIVDIVPGVSTFSFTSPTRPPC